MKTWSTIETEILKNNCTKGIIYLENKLNRTRRSIYKKAYTEGVKIRKIVSNETKIKISKSLKKAHKEGRHPGWLFINSDINNRSFPEKFLISIFKENLLFDKYTIKEKLKYNKYYIDFLIVDLKLIIEMDGSQHYRDKKSIEHDILRDRFFINEGFKIYRIKWVDMCNNTKVEIDELINFILNIENNSIRLYELSDIKKKNFCSCGVEINLNSKKCSKCYHISSRKVNRPSYKELLKDIGDIGYVGTGKKYNVSDNSIRKWVKYYMVNL